MGLNPSPNGVVVVKANNKAPKAPSAGRMGWNLWNAVGLVAIVSVSVGVGFGVGWSVEPSHTAAPQPVNTTTGVPANTTTSVSTPATAHPSFLLFGDSLTEQGRWANGWVSLLQQAYTPAVGVLNRGKSGFNADQTLHAVLPSVLQELASSAPPVFITLWLGANDAALSNGPNTEKHVPIDQYKTKMRAIISQLRQFAPLAKILLISPPLVDDAERRQWLLNDGQPGDPLDRPNEQAGMYAAACSEVASAVDATPDRVTLLNMHSFLTETYPTASDRAALLRDGLHFSDRGNAVVFERIKRVIDTQLPSSLLRA